MIVIRARREITHHTETGDVTALKMSDGSQCQEQMDEQGTVTDSVSLNLEI